MFVRLMRVAGLALLAVLCCELAQPLAAPTRVEKIRRKGVLTCGVAPDVPGFASVDQAGRYSGFDVDICRAVATAILGTADKVRFVRARTVAEFRKNDDIDIVSRRLTWELQREAPLGLLFGPITFYDGQKILVAKRAGVAHIADLTNAAICVATGTRFEFELGQYFAAHRLTLKKILVVSADDLADVANALAAGRCTAYSADESELGAIRSRLPRPMDYDILPDFVTKEPLAQLVRQEDIQFFDILRWTVFALVRGEELGVTSTNVDQMLASENVDVQRLLGVVPGNGKALGLDERWAYHVIKALGNYGELFAKNVGRESPIGLERGLNRLWSDGGLMYAPPLR